MIATSNIKHGRTHQQRENQSHNIDGPCRAETGEHGEAEVTPQGGDLLSLPVLHEVRALAQCGLGVHDRLQCPPPRQRKQRGEAEVLGDTERGEVEAGEGRQPSSDDGREKLSRERREGHRGGLKTEGSRHTHAAAV